MKKTLLILTLVTLGYMAAAQDESATADSGKPYRVQRELALQADSAPQLATRHTQFSIDVTTFMRDAAFSLPYTRGYTALGYFLAPQFSISNSHYAITLGVNLAGAAGYDGLHSWQPLVRLEYEPARNVRLVMGSIYGGLSHGLFEPMLDRERYIYDHNEEGMQILASAQGSLLSWKMDTWLHWEELLEPWQMTQERFALGSSQEVVLLPEKDVTLSLPFSFLGTHRGGQFTALDTCIQSLFNENIGLRLNWSLGSHRALAVDMPFFFFQDISPRKCLAYEKGWAYWPQVTLDWKLGSGRPHPDKDSRGEWRMLLQGGYWHGDCFIAPRGSYLFQSVSWHKAAFAVAEREMLTAKAALENRYNEAFSMDVDAEFYYDMVEQGLDFAFGIYLRYHPSSLRAGHKSWHK